MIFRFPFSIVHVIPQAFGLSISGRSMKFVHLKEKGTGFTLNSFGEYKFTKKGLMDRGVITSPKVLVTEIQKGLSKYADKNLPPHAVVSLPEEDIFIRIVQVPQMNTEELQEAIKWETEANIPVSIDNVYYDYHIIPTKKSTHPGHLDVLVTAIPKPVVDAYVEAIEGAGIQPIVLEPESMALARALVKGQETASPVLLLDIGYTRTRLVVYSGSNVRFTSFVPFSVQTLIQTLSHKKTSTSLEESERLLFRDGLKTRGKVFKALLPEFTEFISQVKKYVSFYNDRMEHDHGSKSKITKAILAGGGSLVPGIGVYLTDNMDLFVSAGNPWVNIFPGILKKIPSMSYRDSMRFAPVLGLALRGANIRPPKTTHDKT